MVKILFAVDMDTVNERKYSAHKDTLDEIMMISKGLFNYSFYSDRKRKGRFLMRGTLD